MDLRKHYTNDQSFDVVGSTQLTEHEVLYRVKIMSARDRVNHGVPDDVVDLVFTGPQLRQLQIFLAGFNPTEQAEGE